MNKSVNRDAPKLVTPQATTAFASLLKGVVFGAEPTPANPGHLESLLILDPSKPEVAAWLSELDNVCKSQVEKFTGQKFSDLVAAGKCAEVPYSLKDDLDENKKPTGNKRIKVRRTAGGTRPDGSAFTNSVPFCDSQGAPIELTEELGNGSIVRAIITPYVYASARVGVSLQLRSIQVIEARKRPSKGGGDFDMFGTVEPKPIPETPAANSNGGDF